MEGAGCAGADRRRGGGSDASNGRRRGRPHLSVNTMGAGLKTVDDHLAALATAAAALGLKAQG